MNRNRHKLEDAGAESAAPEQQPQAEEAAAEETEKSGELRRLAEENGTIAKERDDYLNLLQRVQADFDNYRRRNQNAREDAYADGVRDTLEKFLPVLDNLERASCAVGDGNAIAEGVQLVLRQFNTLLANCGVEEIKAEGCVFDPNLHHAVMQEPTEGVECGTVVSVLQKGYTKDGRVLRHCMVKVAE